MSGSALDTEAETLLRAHAREAVSAAMVAPAMHFVVAEGGVLAYVDVLGARVFAGSPVAATVAEREALTRRRGASGRRVVVFGRELEDDEPMPTDAYVVGEQPWWDPREWPRTVDRSRSLRSQLRRAANKGVHVRECAIDELAMGAPLRSSVEALLAGWLRGRHMPPLAFVARVAPFAQLAVRRVWVAELRGEVIGALFAARLGGGEAWLFDHIVRGRDAPNGTAELLVDAAMRGVAEGGADAVTLGLCPLAGRVPWPLALVQRVSRGLFDFAGLYAFKRKLQPARWVRVLVEHPKQSALLATLRALRAFAGGSLIGFGVRAALRAPPALVRAVAALLIVWIALLAQPAAAAYFPSPWIWRGWIAFDVCVAASLFVLARRDARRRPSPWLHRGLALSIAADALLTTTQALLWNVPRLHGVLDAMLVVAGCAAPTLVAIVLISALRFR